jgi:hypothetical protein
MKKAILAIAVLLLFGSIAFSAEDNDDNTLKNVSPTWCDAAFECTYDCPALVNGMRSSRYSMAVCNNQCATERELCQAWKMQERPAYDAAYAELNKQLKLKDEAREEFDARSGIEPIPFEPNVAEGAAWCKESPQVCNRRCRNLVESGPYTYDACSRSCVANRRLCQAYKDNYQHGYSAAYIDMSVFLDMSTAGINNWSENNRRELSRQNSRSYSNQPDESDMSSSSRTSTGIGGFGN